VTLLAKSELIVKDPSDDPFNDLDTVLTSHAIQENLVLTAVRAY